MNFELSAELIALRDEVRTLALRHIAPHAAHWDETASFPAEAVRLLANRGLFGLNVPVAYGGLGLDPLAAAVVFEELARYDAGLALTLSSHSTLVCGHLLLAGNETQKCRYLPALARGEKLGAWALTETGSGSDPASLRTTATADVEGWCLDGRKMFVTQGRVAGLYIVFARTVSAGGADGISAFLLESAAAGVEPGPPLRKMGCRSSDTSALRLRSVRLPATALLGGEGEGLADALRLLDGGRIGIAAMAVGIARGCLEESLAFARRRRQFGKPIASFQAIQGPLADLATELDAARLLVWRAALLQGCGSRCTREASMAKLFASQVAVRAADRAVQIHGGYGYLRPTPVERYLRDARVCELGEGTSEIQRLVIARDLLRS